MSSVGDLIIYGVWDAVIGAAYRRWGILGAAAALIGVVVGTIAVIAIGAFIFVTVSG